MWQASKFKVKTPIITRILFQNSIFESIEMLCKFGQDAVKSNYKSGIWVAFVFY